MRDDDDDDDGDDDDNDDDDNDEDNGELGEFRIERKNILMLTMIHKHYMIAMWLIGVFFLLEWQKRCVCIYICIYACIKAYQSNHCIHLKD